MMGHIGKPLCSTGSPVDAPSTDAVAVVGVGAVVAAGSGVIGGACVAVGVGFGAGVDVDSGAFVGAGVGCGVAVRVSVGDWVGSEPQAKPTTSTGNATMHKALFIGGSPLAFSDGSERTVIASAV